MKTFIRKCFDHYVVTKRRAYGTQITLGIFVLPKRRPAGALIPNVSNRKFKRSFLSELIFAPTMSGRVHSGKFSERRNTTHTSIYD